MNSAEKNTVSTHFDTKRIRCNIHWTTTPETSQWLINISKRNPTTHKTEDRTALSVTSDEALITGFVDWLADFAIQSPQNGQFAFQLIRQLDHLFPSKIMAAFQATYDHPNQLNKV